MSPNEIMDIILLISFLAIFILPLVIGTIVLFIQIIIEEIKEKKNNE